MAVEGAHLGHNIFGGERIMAHEVARPNTSKELYAHMSGLRLIYRTKNRQFSILDAVCVAERNAWRLAYVKTFRTTSPCTSVRRKCRPWYL